MAVGTGAITLSDVVVEIGGTQNSLADCFADACSAGFNGLYSKTGQWLSEFRGYNDNNCGSTCTQLSGIRSSASSGTAACSGTLELSTYGNASTLSSCTAIYSNSTCTNLKPARYYSDGTAWRYWNGTSFGTSGLCF